MGGVFPGCCKVNPMSSPSSGMTQQLTPNLRNAHPQASITASALTAMPQFAVFFAMGGVAAPQGIK